MVVYPNPFYIVSALCPGLSTLNSSVPLFRRLYSLVVTKKRPLEQENGFVFPIDSRAGL